MIDGWKVYNKALLPTTPPHKEPYLSELKNINLWNLGCLLIRYTTDFDCGYETEWWYLIKDSQIDISKLKKKRRYEITKGLNNFDIKKISPKIYAYEIYLVYLAAFQTYLKAGKPLDKVNFYNYYILSDKKEVECYAAFDKDSGELAAYAFNDVFDEYATFSTMKFSPKFLSKNVSAAMVYTMLVEYINIQGKLYVNDGERSIRHITNFQNYLIKYFGFRKAYCKLHVQYSPFFGVIINILMPIRKVLKVFSTTSTLNNISALLEQEFIRKTFISNSHEKQIKYRIE